MKKMLRNSSVVVLPEQFVTVEIQNCNSKKRMRAHRESILHQLKNTEDLLNQTLNRDLLHPKSKFSPNFKGSATPNPNSRKRHLRTEEATQRMLIDNSSSQIGRKLKQLTNISHHFDIACETRRTATPAPNFSPISYSLPIDTVGQQYPEILKKSKEQMQQHRNFVREWKNRINLGRKRVSKIRIKNPLRMRDPNSKFQTRMNSEQSQDDQPRRTLKSLRDIYFSQLRKQRNTAPAHSHNLQALFCQRRDRQNLLGYVSSVEDQPAMQLQKFIEGGEQRTFDEYSEYFNIGQFQRSKQKYSTLRKVYQHLKDHNQFDFKDMQADEFQKKNMLSVVYYLQNGHNLTEIEKRGFKKRLKIIE